MHVSCSTFVLLRDIQGWPKHNQNHNLPKRFCISCHIKTAFDGTSDEESLCFLCVPLCRRGIWCSIQGTPKWKMGPARWTQKRSWSWLGCRLDKSVGQQDQMSNSIFMNKAKQKCATFVWNASKTRCTPVKREKKLPAFPYIPFPRTPKNEIHGCKTRLAWILVMNLRRCSIKVTQKGPKDDFSGPKGKSTQDKITHSLAFGVIFESLFLDPEKSFLSRRKWHFWVRDLWPNGVSQL